MPQQRWLIPEMQGCFSIQKFVNKIHHTNGSNEKTVLKRSHQIQGQGEENHYQVFTIVWEVLANAFRQEKEIRHN